MGNILKVLLEYRIYRKIIREEKGKNGFDGRGKFGGKVKERVNTIKYIF